MMIKMTESRSYMQPLVKYIKKNLSKGYTLESLKWALVSQGYGKLEINKSIELVNKELAESAPKLVEKPVIRVEVEQIKPDEERGFFSWVKSFFR